MEKPNQRQQWAKGLALFSWVVADLVIYTLAGAGVGYWIHSKWNGPEWLMFATSMLGFGVAIFQLIRLSQKKAAKKE